jgi:hypothetical protein
MSNIKLIKTDIKAVNCSFSVQIIQLSTDFIKLRDNTHYKKCILKYLLKINTCELTIFVFILLNVEMSILKCINPKLEFLCLLSH